MATEISLNDFTVNLDNGEQAVWRDNYGPADPLLNTSGETDGCLTIHLNVDGDAAIVYHHLRDTDHIEALSAGIGALNDLLTKYLAVHRAAPVRRGRCLQWNHERRCNRKAGHLREDCDFTEPSLFEEVDR